MTVTGVNHVTLAVADLPRSLAFYTDLLRARLAADWQTGAYLELGTLWLCLAEGPVTPRSDYTHLALSRAASEFGPLSTRIRAKAELWQDNTSEGASLYVLDPDGHRLELHVGTLADRLSHYTATGRTDIRQHPV